MLDWDTLISSISTAYDPSVSLKVVEAAKKYARLDVSHIALPR